MIDTRVAKRGVSSAEEPSSSAGVWVEPTSMPLYTLLRSLENRPLMGRALSFGGTGGRSSESVDETLVIEEWPLRCEEESSSSEIDRADEPIESNEMVCLCREVCRNSTLCFSLSMMSIGFDDGRIGLGAMGTMAGACTTILLVSSEVMGATSGSLQSVWPICSVLRSRWPIFISAGSIAELVSKKMGQYANESLDDRELGMITLMEGRRRSWKTAGRDVGVGSALLGRTISTTCCSGIDAGVGLGLRPCH